MRKTHNKDLQFIKEDWLGNSLDQDNRYINLDGPSEKGFMEFLKWQMGSNTYASQKKGQRTNVHVNTASKFLSSGGDYFTWLGHATFLFQLDGIKMITDPVLYDIWPLKRCTALPCTPEQLIDLDIILLSHNHRDHADEKSMKLLTQQNPNAVIFTGLEIGKLLKGWGIKNEIVEAGWYQAYPNIHPSIAIHYLPAKHWNRRYLHDLNQMLWGSFMIQYRGKNLYFGADSGLGQHFKKIGLMYDIDIAFLGIGAYEPVWFMHTSHTSPKDVLQAKIELNAEVLIPMHYGTFDLSNEPIFNPKSELKKLIGSRKDVHIPDIGDLNDLSFLF
ncbi:MAG: MBL fold metallo-hydrolase [Saprospiraceae bacterium]|nr:MBL fold metallo-hydrolase [Saprospiraceae bacterium]